jgi:hypothetical protein
MRCSTAVMGPKRDKAQAYYDRCGYPYLNDT